MSELVEYCFMKFSTTILREFLQIVTFFRQTNLIYYYFYEIFTIYLPAEKTFGELELSTRTRHLSRSMVSTPFCKARIMSIPKELRCFSFIIVILRINLFSKLSSTLINSSTTFFDVDAFRRNIVFILARLNLIERILFILAIFNLKEFFCFKRKVVEA